MTVNYHSKNKGSLVTSEIISKLVYQFSLAKQEAILNQRKIIFSVDNERYFFKFVDADAPLIDEKIEQGMDVKIDAPEMGEPIIIFPNGEITFFKLSVNHQKIYLSKKGTIEREEHVSE